MIKTVSIVGAGNVAHNLGRMFLEKGITIDSVYSKDLSNAEGLAEMLGARPVNDLNNMEEGSDLLLLAVKDDVLAEVGKTLEHSSQLMAHTSGSVEMNVFGAASRTAVFYPLQTFSKGKVYEGMAFPVCIEALQPADLEDLKSLAALIVGSENVYEINSEKRKTLHVAAVFACNFSNYFYAVAEDIVKEQDMSFDILRPLIHETISKIDERGPSLNQTGPAVRGDEKIIADHLEYLESSPEYKRLYQMITDQIMKR